MTSLSDMALLLGRDAHALALELCRGRLIDFGAIGFLAAAAARQLGFRSGGFHGAENPPRPHAVPLAVCDRCAAPLPKDGWRIRQSNKQISRTAGSLLFGASCRCFGRRASAS